MILKAILEYNASRVFDIPLGDYDTGDGTITILERVLEDEHLGLGVYWMIKIHSASLLNHEQAYNEFANVCLKEYCPGMVLKDQFPKADTISFAKDEVHVPVTINDAEKLTKSICNDIVLLENKEKSAFMDQLIKVRKELFKLIKDVEMAKE